MGKFYEYALTSVEGSAEALVTQGWTQDYAAVRALRRQYERDGKTVFILTQEVVTSLSPLGLSEPRYDIDNLVDQITPILVKLGVINETDFADPNDLLDEVERIALSLMPTFAESIAQSIVANAIAMYSIDEEDVNNEALKRSYEEKKDKMFDQAAQVRNIGGVPSWSHNAGTGYSPTSSS